MPWVTRGTRRYFYRSVRRNGRVERHYLGGGEDGRLAALLVEQRRRQRQDARRARQAEREKWDRATLELLRLIQTTDTLARDALTAAGFHEHRGQWRRRKMLKLIDPESGESTLDAQTSEILARGHQGDVAVLPQLQELLDQRPDLWRWAGDLAAHARESLLGLAAGNSLLVRESIRRKMDELATGLAEPAASPLVQLLIDRVVLCWVQVHLADLDAVAQDQGAAPRAAHARQRQNAAQKRYVQAIKALAVVRRMLRPAVRPVAPPARCLPEVTSLRAPGAVVLAAAD
jgi:hypothetical protein